MRRDAVYITIILILLLSAVFALDRYRHEKIEKMAYVSANDVLSVEIDKAGNEIASKNQIIVESERQYRQLDLSFDSMHLELQSRVKKMKGNVTSSALISSTTELTSSSQTIRDTVDAIVVYKGAHKDEWVEWNGAARADSFIVHFIVENKYQFSEVVRNPLFEPKETIVQVVNLNPYTRTKSIASYTVKETTKRFGVGPQVGYGLDIKTSQPSFNVGIGIQARIIGF